MNEIGLLMSTFGGGGLFIWYLLNKEKTITRELIRAVYLNGESTDDLIIKIGDLLDYIMPTQSDRQVNKDIRSRVSERRKERERNELLRYRD